VGRAEGARHQRRTLVEVVDGVAGPVRRSALDVLLEAVLQVANPKS